MAGLDLVGYFPTTLSTYQKISVGTVANNKFSTILNFLEEYGETKILSSPRIVAVNKEEATILVGSREAYITETLSQAQTTTVSSESVQFIDVGVKLKVVPTIGKDGYITMKIKPEVSSVRETLTTTSGSKIPIVDTSQVETVVKVKDGTTIMIAGLIKEEKRDTTTGNPGLSRIPILGIFFGNRIKQNPKTELVIFLTPQLISGATPKKSEAKVEK
jgi:general secretion pathway protein D